MKENTCIHHIKQSNVSGLVNINNDECGRVLFSWKWGTEYFPLFCKKIIPFLIHTQSDMRIVPSGSSSTISRSWRVHQNSVNWGLFGAWMRLPQWYMYCKASSLSPLHWGTLMRTIWMWHYWGSLSDAAPWRQHLWGNLCKEA